MQHVRGPERGGRQGEHGDGVEPGRRQGHPTQEHRPGPPDGEPDHGTDRELEGRLAEQLPPGLRRCAGRLRGEGDDRDHGGRVVEPGLRLQQADEPLGSGTRRSTENTAAASVDETIGAEQQGGRPRPAP